MALLSKNRTRDKFLLWCDLKNWYWLMVLVYHIFWNCLLRTKKRYHQIIKGWCISSIAHWMLRTAKGKASPKFWALCVKIGQVEQWTSSRLKSNPKVVFFKFSHLIVLERSMKRWKRREWNRGVLPCGLGTGRMICGLTTHQIEKTPSLYPKLGPPPSMRVTSSYLFNYCLNFFPNFCP